MKSSGYGYRVRKKMCELHYDKGKSYEELAEKYDISESEVKESIQQYNEEREYNRIKQGKIWENVDMPKVFALKRAGWSDEDIALEIRVSVYDLNNIIKCWQQDTGKKEHIPNWLKGKMMNAAGSVSN